MARIFITGSADGLGQLAAKSLINQEHQVVLHARNEQRAKDALNSLPQAENVLVANLSNIEDTKLLAQKVNALGRFDAIIHNAGVYQATSQELLAINTFAPYILTSLIAKPQRLIYLSSGMHLQGDATLKGLLTDKPVINYSDSKLHDLILTKAVARHWPDVYSNAVDPGWVPTKMGGAGAPDNLEKGYQTQVWLAASNDDNAKISGRYLHHQREAHYHQLADNIKLQEQFLAICQQITGIQFPA